LRIATEFKEWIAPLSTRTIEDRETVMKTPHILLVLAATLTTTLGASGATAQAPATGERLVVSYADLDLGSRAGVRTLNRRILTAVQTACGTMSDSDPHGKNLITECRHRTFDQASSQVRQAIALARRDGPTVFAGR
jgi:UrcA family protein